METVTVKDVARKAGVSTTTVSFVMSNKSFHIPISEATREKVLQAVKELGYKPNIFAQVLARRKIKRLKLVGPSYIVTHLDAEDKGLDPRLFTFLKGALDEAQNKGYQITLISRDTEEVKDIHKDISIISGTNFIAPQQGISITALKIPLYEGGCEAVKLLEESLENRKYTYLSALLQI